MALTSHTAYQHGGGIIGLGYAHRELSWRGLIHRRRRAHLECFMGTHLVIFLAKTIELLLLLAPIGRGWLGDLLLQGATHAFVPPAFLRMSGFIASQPAAERPAP